MALHNVTAFVNNRHWYASVDKILWACANYKGFREKIAPEFDVIRTFPILLILFFIQHRDLPSIFFLANSPAITMYTRLCSPACITWPAYLTALDLITLIIFGDECKLRKFSVCNFHRFLVFSSIVGPNIFLSTPFSNILTLLSAFSITDQV
jgi:hypothetical protein